MIRIGIGTAATKRGSSSVWSCPRSGQSTRSGNERAGVGVPVGRDVGVAARPAVAVAAVHGDGLSPSMFSLIVDRACHHVGRTSSTSPPARRWFRGRGEVFAVGGAGEEVALPSASTMTTRRCASGRCLVGPGVCLGGDDHDDGVASLEQGEFLGVPLPSAQLGPQRPRCGGLLPVGSSPLRDPDLRVNPVRNGGKRLLRRVRFKLMGGWGWELR